MDLSEVLLILQLQARVIVIKAKKVLIEEVVSEAEKCSLLNFRDRFRASSSNI